MASINSFDWFGLPHEIKLTVLDNLPLRDVRSCSRTDRESYSVCLPTLFKTVKLPSLEALLDFLKAVPPHHYPLIRDLSISTKSHLDDYHDYDAFTRPASPDANDPLAALLSKCTSLDSLAISVCGSLDAETMLPVFRVLERVKRLKLENLEQEEIEPLSERLVVSLAFSLPQLEELSLTRITRSALHAPELHCSNVPIVQGDDCIPAHPVLGHELRLPQLLRLPRLKHLRIRDTHLGDPLWVGPALDAERPGTDAGAGGCCPLEVLDLGSCAHISPAANERHTARILARVPSSITACALSASLPPAPSQSIDSPLSPTCKSPAGLASSPLSPSAGAGTEAETETCIPPLPRLRTLHLTPLVPTSALGSTLAQPALAGSPVHTLSCAFHPDDAAEGCAVLEAFLRARACAPPSSPLAPRPVGRKRASSKLSLYAETETGTGVGGDDGSAESGVARARANTTASVSASVAPIPSSLSLTPTPTRLYPSLSTLAIDIPDEAPLSAHSPSTVIKLSPRRLAAAQRRAEERRTAALRLQALAQELGLEVIMHGIDLGDAGRQGTTTTTTTTAGAFGYPFSKIGGEKGAVRARANTA